MFNKKEISDLKEEVSKQLEDLRSSISLKSESHSKSSQELHNLLLEIKDENRHNVEKLKGDMFEILKLKNEFETSLHRIQSVSRTIEDRAAESVRQVAEKEIEVINYTTKQFRNMESELRSVADKINLLNQELSKFVSISQQIKLVDFSLKKYQEEIKSSERERTEILNENERLKSIMAKMKRNY